MENSEQAVRVQRRRSTCDYVEKERLIGNADGFRLIDVADAIDMNRRGERHQGVAEVLHLIAEIRPQPEKDCLKSGIRRRVVIHLAAYAVLLAAPAGAPSLSVHLPKAAVERLKPIQLPADDVRHGWAHTEWWYVIGHLRDTQGRRFGFETTLFAFNHLWVPGFGRQVSIDRSDTALTDVRGRAFLHSVSYITPGSGSDHLSSKRFSEQLGPNELSRSGQSILLRSTIKSARLRLSLTVRKPPLLEGGKGIVPMGRSGYSYYYSYPRLSASGSLRYRGRWVTVRGLAWMDHQWGDWRWSNILGWTWGALQLDNGMDLSVSRFRTRGAALGGVSASYANRSQRTFKDVTIHPLSHWKSPRDSTTYGSGWTIRIPGLRATFTIRPLLRDQEVYDPTFPSSSYWEGDSSVTGRIGGRSVSGVAYMELVGGSHRFRPG